MRRYVTMATLAGVIGLLGAATNGQSVDAASDTLAVEAEALVGLHADSGQWLIAAYEHASGKASLYPKSRPLQWTVRPPRAGTYYFWLRARSGWNGDHFQHEGDDARYVVTLGARRIAMQTLRDTLDWHGDGENFIWLRSEPLNLDAQQQAIQVQANWEWAHLDRFVLTSDAAFRPGVGNVSANEQLAGRLTVWADSPYVHPLRPDLAPPAEPAAAVDVAAPRGGSACGAIFLRLDSDSDTTVPFRLFVQPLRGPDGATLTPTLSIVAATGMVVGAPLATDALPPINPMGAFDLAPGTTRALWLVVNVPRDAAPGRYTGSIAVENQISLKQQGVAVHVDVARTTLAPRTDLTVFSWWGGHHLPQSWWDDQIAHGVNSFLLNVHYDLRYRFDAEGNLLGAIDFSGLEPLLRAQRATGGSILVNWYLHDAKRAMLVCESPGVPADADGARGAPLTFMSEPWRKAFATLLTQTQAHLESHGVPREHVLHYTFDEYLGERFVQVGQLIRGLDPSYRIFSDLSADLQTYQRVAPYVDVWCPLFDDLDAMDGDGRLAFMRSTGKPIWAYDPGYTQRGEPPYRKFRTKFWHAWRLKLDGCTYWKHQGDRVGTAYYPMVAGDPPVTSRRYEAWFSGWQDYQLLRQLDAAARGDGEHARRAAALLEEAVANVCGQPDAVHRADHYRRQMLDVLDAALQ